jgi:hypothetical protein
MNEPLIPETPDTNQRFVMEYHCDCGEAWTDMWVHCCNDKCPSCGKEVEPSSVEDITLEPPTPES